MADTLSAILDFLHKHKFSVAEDALRSELSARQNGIGSLPLALDEEFDLSVHSFLQAMQDRDAGEQQAPYRSEPDISVAPTERSKAAQSGFNFIHGRLEAHDGETFHESAFAVPEKAVFIDTGIDIDESLKSSRMTKTSLGRHGTAVETDIGARKSGGDDVNVEDSAQQRTTFTLGGQRYNKVLPSSKHKQMPVKDNSLQEEDAVAVQVFDEPQSRNQVLGREEQLNFQVDEDDMIRPDLWKTEDVSFEESRRVESQGSERDVVNLLDCSERIGEIELEKPNTQLPRKIGSSRKAAPKSGPTRIISDLDIWDVPQGSKEDTQYDNGQDHDEKSILVRDMIANERPSKRQILSEDTERPELHLGNGASPPVTVPKEMGTVENGVGARKNHGRGVPIKTPLPQPVAEALSNTLKTAEPLFSGGDLESLPVEDKISQVKSSEAPVVTRSRRSSRERARSADAGLKSHESGSRAVHDAQAELPRLPHVKVRSGDPKMIDCSKDGLAGSTFKPSPESGALMASGVCTDGPYGLGSFLDVPVGQDVSTTGMRRSSGASRPSVSQGIVEDASERLSGIATAGDGQSESVVEYPDEYWDSDTYDDDEDPGYHRQPIDDEEWFLAHEIDYPDERSSGGLESSRGHHEKDFGKYEDDDRSVLEEESYYSGEEHYRSKRDEHRELPSEIERLGASDVYGLVEESQNRALRRQTGSQLRETTEYDGQLLDVEELSMIRGEPDWQGFPLQASHEVAGGDKIVLERARDEVGSVRSGGVGISSEVAEFGSEVRGSMVGGSIIGGSSEGDLESLKDREMGGFGSLHVREAKKVSSQKELFNDMEGIREVLKDASNRNPDEEEVDRDMMLRIYSESWSHRGENVERQVPDRVFQQRKGGSKGSNGNVDTRCEGEQDMGGGFGFGGFSFPSPSSAGDVVVMSRADSGKSLWSVRDIVTPGRGDAGDNCANGIVGPDDTLAEWKRKSNESSPIISPRNETLRNLTLSTDSTISAQSTDGCGSAEMKDGDDEIGISDITKDEADAVAADDEEAAAVQEQISRIRAEEEEFETFNLKIVHRKNRTGFEEEKEFPVVLNSVIAGRYHVTEYLGSAAFSKAIQAHDLHTGMDVCMKIIKNNKDFFDQSLDEIKLLKYINKHDPGDKYHVLRLYDYFYHREHLFIVCELLRANLYEFHKYNRESGGEVYFTMPRLQSITRQCLEALEFIHGLKLIHCDLKPENILVKSYSRCEVKVIDLGSSCFQTDHLCSYVQSRSYRAPEVILGLPYNQKIDMWSLGCILAELCSGNVLFQNESLATLLARVVGILGPIDSEMLARGRDSHKFFTKNHMLYERNQESERLEYLVPKKTSLTHRLPMGDQGFVDFVGYLLQINPASRPTATEALKHPWLSYPYEPISA